MDTHPQKHSHRTQRPLPPQDTADLKRGLSRSFQRITETAGLPRIRLHDARHGCATLLFAAGVPARMVMEILGHSQIAVTMNIYTHVSEGHRREAMDHMDRLLRRQPRR
ncbi:tyrosine-type recombinase/integrase [Streptomyces sp. NPDC057217]|uniref:tyrosine-type recombinase/integrase n=1 Tax=Streptomyces sp. NPDC057217 TaxID=3346054 RepID=UPI003645DF4C